MDGAPAASGNTRRGGARRGRATLAMLRCGNIALDGPRRASLGLIAHEACTPHERTAPLPTSAHADATQAAPMRRACARFPYNYTSFSDREIVIRLLGERAWEVLDAAARRAPHRPLGAHALRGAGRHLGRAAQSLPAGRPARQPAPARLLIDALHHRLGEIEKRRTPADDAGARRASSASCWRCAQRRRRRLRGAVSRGRGTCAQAHARACCRASPRKDNIKFDGLSRVSHVTDATDWRVEYPFVVLTPDTEAEMAGAGRAAASSSA